MGANSIYRSRLSKGYDKETAEFVSSLQEDLWIAMEDIDGTEAHNIMLADQKIISKKDLDSILKALEEVRGGLLKQNHLEGEFEDIHEYVESKVIKLIGIEKGGKMHTGRSRNDQVALDLRLKTRNEIVETLGLILDLMKTLHDNALKDTDTLAPLYTHTQHAQVGLLAQYYSCYIESLYRSFERLLECYKRVNLSPLGACAIGGTSFPIDRVQSMILLGFEGLVENSVDAVSSRDFLVEAVACLSNLIADLTRMAEDIVLWSTSEYGYVELSDEYSSTSSVMPHKKNPCPLELIRGKSGTVYSALISLLTQIKGIPTGYNRDLQESKVPVKAGFSAVKSSLKVLNGVIKTLNINHTRLKKAVDEGFLTAVDLAEALSMRYDISFREAHMIIGKVVMSLANQGLKMKDVKPEDIAKASYEVSNKKIQIPSNELNLLIDPKECVLRRRSRGSSSPTEVRRLIKSQGKTISKCQAIHRKLIETLKKSSEALRSEVERHLD